MRRLEDLFISGRGCSSSKAGTELHSSKLGTAAPYLQNIGRHLDFALLEDVAVSHVAVWALCPDNVVDAVHSLQYIAIRSIP